MEPGSADSSSMVDVWLLPAAAGASARKVPLPVLQAFLALDDVLASLQPGAASPKTTMVIVLEGTPVLNAILHYLQRSSDDDAEHDVATWQTEYVASMANELLENMANELEKRKLQVASGGLGDVMQNLQTRIHAEWNKRQLLFWKEQRSTLPAGKLNTK